MSEPLMDEQIDNLSSKMFGHRSVYEWKPPITGDNRARLAMAVATWSAAFKAGFEAARVP